MIKLHFETTVEFEKLFRSKTKEITDGMVSGIERAMNTNKKIAFLFDFIFNFNSSFLFISHSPGFRALGNQFDSMALILILTIFRV